jgi:phage baseplate assembly protein W
MIMATRATFLGSGWAFPPGFDARAKGALMVANEEDVAQSLRILLATEPGERVMQPTYGCGLRRLVFETIDQNRITEIKDVVAKAVLFFEPRVELLSVEVDEPDPLHGVLRVHLEYQVRTTNNRHNLVYPLYLREASGTGHEA